MKEKINEDGPFEKMSRGRRVRMRRRIFAPLVFLYYFILFLFIILYPQDPEDSQILFD